MQIELYSPTEHGTEIAFWAATTPFGRTQIAIIRTGICFLSFDETDVRPLHELQCLYPECTVVKRCTEAHRIAFDAVNNLRNDVSLPLIWRGTHFQQTVWQALLSIPRGKTVHYQFIARSINHPLATRAVGTAIGRNAISYFVPCHRVLQSSGKPGNYRWGVKVKQQLIDTEKGAMEE